MVVVAVLAARAWRGGGIRREERECGAHQLRRPRSARRELDCEIIADAVPRGGFEIQSVSDLLFKLRGQVVHRGACPLAKRGWLKSAQPAADAGSDRGREGLGRDHGLAGRGRAEHEVDLTLGQSVNTPNPSQIPELQELIDMQLPGDVQAELDRRMKEKMSSEMATMDDGAATAQAELAATQESEIRAAQRETSGLAEEAQRDQQRQIKSSQAAVDKERGRVLAEQDEAIKKIDAEIADQQDSARKSIQQETKKKQAEIDRQKFDKMIKSKKRKD